MAVTAVMAAVVFLVADASINTLVDFRVARRHRAASGRAGAGRNKTGRSGEDLRRTGCRVARSSTTLIPVNLSVT